MVGNKLIILILLLYCVIFVPHLSRTIMYDEATNFFLHSQSPITALFYYTLPNNHLLHSFFVWLSTTIMGDSLIAIRFPSFAAGILAVAYIYRIGVKLQGQSVGNLAAVLLMLSPHIMEHVPNARGYTLSVLLSLFYFDLVYFQYLQSHKLYRRLLMLTSFLLMLTLPTMIIFIVSLLMWRYLAFPTKETVLNYVLPSLVASVTALAFYLYPILLGDLGIFARFGYFSVDTLILDFVRELSLGLGGVVICIGLIIAYTTWKQSRNLITAVMSLIILAIVFAVIQQLITGRVLYPRNYIYLVTFVVLLAAYGWNQIRFTSSYSPLVMMLLISGVAGLTIYHAQKLDRPTRVDYLQQAIAQYAEENDSFMIGCCLDYPLYYINYDTNRFDFDKNTERYVIVPTHADPLETFLAYLPETTECEAEQWNDFEVYICPVNLNP